jgi:hypothetical protein
MGMRVQGVVHGKTIELDQELGIADGQRVNVDVRITPTQPKWGEGILRSAGIAAVVSGFEEAFDQVQKDRDVATMQEIDE